MFDRPPMCSGVDEIPNPSAGGIAAGGRPHPDALRALTTRAATESLSSPSRSGHPRRGSTTTGGHQEFPTL